MTTIDTAIDAHIDPNELAGSPQTSDAHDDDAALLTPAITADYYNLTEADGWPVAGLVVLLDRHHRPVRAEVHLYDNTTGRRQDEALHNANRLLINEYRSLSEADSRLPLRVMRTRQALDTLTIQLDVGAIPVPAGRTRSPWLNRTTGLAAGAAMLVLAVIVSIVVLLQRNAGPAEVLDEPETPPAVAAAPAAADPAVSLDYGDEISRFALPGTARETATQTDTAAITETAPATAETEAAAVPPPVVEEEAVILREPATYVNPYPPETNELSESALAYDFALLDYAEVNVGHLAMQSAPNPDPTLSIAWKAQGTQVQLIGGPVWREGDSDTVVWWYVEEPDGKKGWMAANGSALPYLKPLQ